MALFFGCTNTDFGKKTGGVIMVNYSEDDVKENEPVFNNLSEYRRAKVGDNVTVHYTGRLENGEIFDSSVGRQPLPFKVGAGQMIKGFDDAVIGMKIGDKKTINLPPEQAYGDVDDSRIVTFDSNSFADFNLLKVGMVVSASNGLSGKIIEKNDLNAVIDFNHELAGKTLVFDIELVSIE